MIQCKPCKLPSHLRSKACRKLPPTTVASSCVTTACGHEEGMSRVLPGPKLACRQPSALSAYKMPACAKQLGTVQILLMILSVSAKLGKIKPLHVPTRVLSILSSCTAEKVYEADFLTTKCTVCSACLLLRGRPLLEGFHVLRRWRHQYECLAACHHMIPHRAPPKVNVEICVAACGAHEPIKQHLPSSKASLKSAALN